MPLARINGTLLHFVHVPKTGGSSIKEYLKAKGSLALYNWTPIAWARTCPQHITADTHRILVPKGFADHDFIVFRDPVERLISEFRYRSQPPDEKGRIWVDLDEGGRFEGGFDGWAQAVFQMHTQDPYACDNHIRPQSEFWRDGLVPFFFEDGVDQVLRWIDDVTGTPALPGTVHENKGRRVEVNISGATRTAIKAFYYSDYVLMARLRKKLVAHVASPRVRKSG